MLHEHHPQYPRIHQFMLTSIFSAPTEKTTFAWQHMPNSGLVVRHGDDHVSFNRK